MLFYDTAHRVPGTLSLTEELGTMALGTTASAYNFSTYNSYDNSTFELMDLSNNSLLPPGYIPPSNNF